MLCAHTGGVVLVGSSAPGCGNLMTRCSLSCTAAVQQLCSCCAAAVHGGEHVVVKFQRAGADDPTNTTCVQELYDALRARRGGAAAGAARLQVAHLVENFLNAGGVGGVLVVRALELNDGILAAMHTCGCWGARRRAGAARGWLGRGCTAQQQSLDGPPSPHTGLPTPAAPANATPKQPEPTRDPSTSSTSRPDAPPSAVGT